VLQAISQPSLNCPLNWNPPDGINTALDTFVGYLLLDAWIGNTDRHHENWGFVKTVEKKTHLAPTYDHASCLGRELLDTAREKRLQNSSVAAYTNKARSALFTQSGDNNPLLTVDAFAQSTQRAPQAASVWLQNLDSIASATIEELLSRIPKNRISPKAIAFALRVLDINKSKLLCLQEILS
ncbi:MAG: HipA domain-containing protein, partial [Phormidesmis sp.]